MKSECVFVYHIEKQRDFMIAKAGGGWHILGNLLFGKFAGAVTVSNIRKQSRTIFVCKSQHLH